MQYVTNQQGELVGVLLDLETYQQLTQPQQPDDELLRLSHDELFALAVSALAPNTQTQLSELLARHQDSQLSDSEIATLDELLARVDHLNILKTRARYTLKRLYGVENVT